jgi:hypothetical protein
MVTLYVAIKYPWLHRALGVTTGADNIEDFL